MDQTTSDIFVIGGGINGCGIARDAVGRGLSVTLAEMGDLAEATSSRSTKLFHGGLRYLEYFEFHLVREALIRARGAAEGHAAHQLAHAVRAALSQGDALRRRDADLEAPEPGDALDEGPASGLADPAWGCSCTTRWAGARSCRGRRRVDLRKDPAGRALRDEFAHAYEYSDCWVEDAPCRAERPRRGRARGEGLVRTKVVSAVRQADHWVVTVEDVDSGARSERRAKVLVNAGGPWVEDVIRRSCG
jgi:glycerol-3-phosphate dehydrogenase